MVLESKEEAKFREVSWEAYLAKVAEERERQKAEEEAKEEAGSGRTSTSIW